MAVLALGMMGSYFGGAMIGGVLGSQIGWMIGSMIGNALFPPPAQEGPRLSDLKITTSAYGQAVPLIYGTARVSGNCIWSTDKVEHQHSESQGKGGGQSVNTYSYTISTAFAICQGPILAIRKIWANSTLVYDLGSDSPSAIITSEKLSGSIRVYIGDETQLPDGFMQAHDGDSFTPAYRGTAYIIFQDLDLTNFGNMIPNFEFEVVVAGAQTAFRLLNTVTYDFTTLDDSQHEEVWGTIASSKLYYEASGAGGINGVFSFSQGAPRIVGQHGNTINIISAEPKPYYQESYIQSMPTLVTHTTPNYNKTYWTIDKTGAFVGSGNSIIEYSKKQNLLSTFSFNGMVYPFVKEWLCKAGSGNLYYNRIAATSLGGARTVNDLGNMPCNISCFSVSSDDNNPIDFDTSGLMSLLGSHDSGFIVGCFGTEDGKHCIVFTAPTKYPVGGGNGPAQATKWYLFAFEGAYASLSRSGTVDAGAWVYGMGSQSGNSFHAASGMMENSCDYIWTNYGSASLFQIGTDNIVRLIDYAWPVGGGGLGLDYQEWGIFATGGVCYLANQTSYVVYTRIPRVDKLKVKLSDIVSDICLRSGLTAGDIDVTALTDDVVGIVYGAQMSFRSMIEPLQTAYFFDAVESDGKIVFVKRGRAVCANIPEDDLAARDAMTLDAPPDQVKITHQQELELPRRVTIDYFAADADFQDGSQYDAIQTRFSQNVVKLQLPIGLTDNEAKTIAMTNLYALWAGRNSYEFKTNRAYSHLNPTDVVTINKGGLVLPTRIVKRTDGGDGVISWQGVSENSTAYSQAGVGGKVGGGTQVLSTPSTTQLMLLNLPLVEDRFSTTPTLFFAANGYDNTWVGAELYTSRDGLSTFQDTGIALTKPATIGTASSVLPAPKAFGVFDDANSVLVFISNINAELSSDTVLNVLNGVNTASLGGEILSFTTATLIKPRQYRLTGLLRGLFGTEDSAKSHVVGEQFVLLSGTAMRAIPMDSVLINTSVVFKAVAVGDTLDNTRAQSITFSGKNLRDPSPVYFNAAKSSATSTGDWVFSFTPRNRVDGSWRDAVAPINSNWQNDYAIEIYSNGGNDIVAMGGDLHGGAPGPAWPIIRTITAASNFAATGQYYPPVYTVAQQAADLAAYANPVSYVICRVTTGKGTSNTSTFYGAYQFNWASTSLNGGPTTVIFGGGQNFGYLLHCDGTNGGTSFINSGTVAATIGYTGPATTITGDSVFGGSCVDIPYGSRLNLPSDASLAFGSGDFTWAFRVKQINTSGIRLLGNIVGSYTTNQWTLGIQGSVLLLYVYNLGTPLMTSGMALAIGQWYHVAITRSGSNWYLFIDGIIRATATNAGALDGGVSHPFFIGDSGLDQWSTVHIDEFSILKGAALWTSNFTPPSAPY